MGAAMAGSRCRQTRATGGDEAAVTAIRTLRAVMLHCLRSEVHNGSVIGNWDALVSYLRTDMGHAGEERLRILYLDGRSRVLQDEVASTGTIDGTPFYVREIVARALQLGAASMVLAHNHPSGDWRPSRQDCERTRLLADTCKGLEIAVHDHLIVCADQVVSLRSLGLLQS